MVYPHIKWSPIQVERRTRKVRQTFYRCATCSRLLNSAESLEKGARQALRARLWSTVEPRGAMLKYWQVLPMRGIDDAAGGVMSASSSSSTKNATKMFRPAVYIAYMHRWNRADHYIFALWFLSSSSFFLSSPNLRGRTLDVYHTSTHEWP